MLGSSVLPDLLDTRNKVRLGSMRRSKSAICAGSVESSTWSFGKPGFEPKVWPSTSGPRLDPPMPNSSASLNPARFTSSAKSSRCPTAFNP